MVKRRTFIKKSSLFALASGLTVPMFSKDLLSQHPMKNELVKGDLPAMFFQISLAQWSFNKALFGGKLKHLDFVSKTKSLGINGVEYVNQFFKDKAEDTKFLNEMNDRANSEDVTQVLIMIDGEGGLAELDDKERMKAIENHFKWVHAAKHLGCHSIRVNAFGRGSAQDVGKAAVDGLGSLSEYAAKENINVIVENHGGFSSDGKWLSGVMKKIDMKNCGTLPDFGNFCVKRSDGSEWGGECVEEYDRYVGVDELMPYAKAVSAKANYFDTNGNETKTDFLKMMKIVRKHGYSGFVGIEFEGSDISEEEGIVATKLLLEKVGVKLS